MIAFLDASVLIWRVEGAPVFRKAAQSALSRLTARHPALRFAVSPAGTPTQVIARLNAAINRALSAPELRQRLASEGAEAVATTPQIFGAHIAREIERWRPVLKAGNVKAD